MIDVIRQVLREVFGDGYWKVAMGTVDEPKNAVRMEVQPVRSDMATNRQRLPAPVPAMPLNWTDPIRAGDQAVVLRTKGGGKLKAGRETR